MPELSEEERWGFGASEFDSETSSGSEITSGTEEVTDSEPEVKLEGGCQCGLHSSDDQLLSQNAQPETPL